MRTTYDPANHMLDLFLTLTGWCLCSDRSRWLQTWWACLQKHQYRFWRSSRFQKTTNMLMEKLSVGPVLNLTSWRLWRHENHEVTERRRSCSGLNTAGKCLNKKTSSGFMLTNVESLSWTLVCGFTEWDETCVVETSITQLHTTFVFCRNINNI